MHQTLNSEFFLIHQRPEKKSVHHSCSQKNIMSQSSKQARNSKLKNSSTCSLLEESKTNDCLKPKKKLKKKSSEVKTKRPLILINKFQLSLATYIQDHKSEITLKGTKRFSEKTGEYYLQNMRLKKIPDKGEQENGGSFAPSMKESTRLVNYFHKPDGIKSLQRKASEILTKLPDDSLTPIPTINKKEIKNKYEGKELSNAERTAVHIRRLEYANYMKRKSKKTNSKRLLSIILIQQWWKVIYSIIKIQNIYRGFSWRKKLMIDLQYEEWLIERVFLFENMINRILMNRGLYDIYEALGIKRRCNIYEHMHDFDRTSLMNTKFKTWKFNVSQMHNRKMIIKELIKQQWKRNGNNYTKIQNMHNIQTLHFDNLAINQRNYMNDVLFINSSDVEDSIGIHRQIALINKQDKENKNGNEDNNHYHQFYNQLCKIMTLRLREYFCKWVRYIKNLPERNAIISSLINSQYSIKAKEGIPFRMSFEKLNKSNIEFKSMRFNETSYYQTTTNKTKWNDEFKEGDQYDISNVIYKNKDKYIYSKKTPSFNSKIEDLKEINERNSSNYSSCIDRNSHKKEYENMIFTKEKKVNLNENKNIIAQNNTESLMISMKITHDKGIGTRENERELLLNKIMQRQLLKKSFIQFIPSEKRASYLLIESIKKNSNVGNMFTLLGIRKYYFEQWKNVIAKSNILKAIKSNESLIKNSTQNKIKRIMINVINSNMTRKNRNNALNLEEYFNKLRIAAHKIIQYDLLSLELQSVLSHHCKLYILNTLKYYCPIKEPEPQNNCNSYLINYLQHNLFLRKQRMESFEKSQDNTSKKVYYLKYANESNQTKKHHSTLIEDESYSFNQSFSLSNNNGKSKSNNLFSYKVPINSLKKKANNNKVEDNNDSIHLIETKNEIFSPIIYSSQSFFLQKDNQEHSLHKSANIHSDFVSLFDNPHPVIDNIHSQRIQVTKATIPLTKRNNELDNENHLIKQMVIDKCSKDISFKENNKNNNNIEPQSPTDHQYVLPINPELRSQLNVKRDEDLKRISLMNYGQIYDLANKITVPTRHKRTRSDGFISTPLSINLKNAKDNDCFVNTHEQGKEKEEVFALQEVNSTQFYHSPVKNNRNKSQGDIDNQTGIYTNIDKSSKRGKKPLFHNKRDSIDNINSQMSILSSEKDNKDLSFNSIQSQNKISNLSEFKKLKPASSISLYETEVGMSARQLHSVISKEITPIQYSNNKEYIFHMNHHQNNYYSLNNHHLYSTNSNIMANDNFQTCSYLNEFNNSSFNTGQNNRRNSCPKLIRSKTIVFKPCKQEYYSPYLNRRRCLSMIYKPIDYLNPIEPKNYFNHLFKSMLLKHLFNTASLFRKHDNFIYLIKITFHYKRVNQLFISKNMIDNWRMIIRTNKNSHQIIQGGKDKSQMINSIYVERPVFSRYKLSNER